MEVGDPILSVTVYVALTTTRFQVSGEHGNSKAAYISIKLNDGLQTLINIINYPFDETI